MNPGAAGKSKAKKQVSIKEDKKILLSPTTKQKSSLHKNKGTSSGADIGVKKLNSYVSGSEFTLSSIGKEDKDKQDEAQTSLDAGFDLSDQRMDEQLEDSESNKQNIENVIQKTNQNYMDQEYKVFTTEFDEITKAEILEDIKEKEIRELKRELQDAQMERDILKKAVGIFSKTDRNSTPI